MAFAERGDDPVSAWQIFATFGIGLGTGLTLGWICGHAVGFYLGVRYERKRLSRVLANQTALEVVTQLINTGQIKPAKKKKASPPAGIPRDETRH